MLQRPRVERRLVSLPHPGTKSVDRPTKRKVRLGPEAVPPLRWHTFFTAGGQLKAPVAVRFVTTSSGSGTLTSKTAIALRMPLGGSGQLAAGIRFNVVGSFSGAGTATGVAFPGARVNGQFTAGGTLASGSRAQGAAPLSGAGTMSSVSYSSGSRFADYTGVGTLSTSGRTIGTNQGSASGTVAMKTAVAAPAAQTAVGTTAASTKVQIAAATSAEGSMSVVLGMKPKFDAAFSDSGNGNRAWTHTSGKAGVILVSLNHLNSGAGTPTPTCDGVAMTLVAVSKSPASAQGFSSLHWIQASAGAHAIAVSTAENYSVGASASYSGVNSVILQNTNASNAAGTLSSGAIAVSDSEVLFSNMMSRQAPTVTSGITRNSVNHPSSFNYVRMLEGDGASPQTNSETQANSSWASVTVKLSAN